MYFGDKGSLIAKSIPLAQLEHETLNKLGTRWNLKDTFHHEKKPLSGTQMLSKFAQVPIGTQERWFCRELHKIKGFDETSIGTRLRNFLKRMLLIPQLIN